MLRHSAEQDAAAAVAVVAAAVALAAVVVARCPNDIFCIASLKRPTGRNQWPLLPFFHLELNVVASWTNVATLFIHEPDFTCSTSDNGIHLLETVNAYIEAQANPSL